MFEDWPAKTSLNVKFFHWCDPHLVEFGLIVIVPIVVVVIFDVPVVFEGSDVDPSFVGGTFVVVDVILFKFQKEFNFTT